MKVLNFDGTIYEARAGSASQPGISFAGDSNTGIYSPGADQLAISTNGVGRLFINSAGDIGIGWASPSYDLHLEKDENALTTSYFRNINTGSSAGSRLIAASVVGNLTFSAYSAAHSVWPATTVINSDSGFTGGMAINTAGANPLRLFTDSTERLRITSTGTVNIVGAGTAGSTQAVSFNGSAPVNSLVVDSSGRCGIGTSLPGAKLVVDGGTSGDQLRLGTDPHYYKIGRNSTSGPLEFYGTQSGFTGYVFGGVDGTRLTIDSSGRVGIGVTSPRQALTFGSLTSSSTSTPDCIDLGATYTSTSASTNLKFKLYVDSSGNTYGFTVNGSSHLEYYAGTVSSPGNHVFLTGGSERARIDSSGRLLVGTSSARGTFDGATPALQIEGTTQSTGFATIFRNGNAGANPATLGIGRSKGTTIGSVTSLASDDFIGRVSFFGADGTSTINAAEIGAYVDGTPGANDMPGRLVFSVTRDGASSPTEAARISATGELSTFSAGSNTAIFNSSSTAGTTNNLILARYGATGYSTGTASFVVYTNGNVQNTNNSYGALSDIKLKENIVDANSQWSDIKALQVRNYNFKEGQTHTQIGLIAQEVELVSPGLVSESPDRDAEGNDLGTVTKSVNYSVLYMKAVKALQEAMERIEQLEARLTAAGID